MVQGFLGNIGRRLAVGGAALHMAGNKVKSKMAKFAAALACYQQQFERQASRSRHLDLGLIDVGPEGLDFVSSQYALARTLVAARALDTCHWGRRHQILRCCPVE